jgi:hypothetical protein
MADHSPAIDPGVVVRRVGVNPALRPHAFYVVRRRRALRPIVVLQVAASPISRELGIALRRVHRRPVCGVRLRGHCAAEQQSRNQNNPFHRISTTLNAPPYSLVARGEYPGSKTPDYKSDRIGAGFERGALPRVALSDAINLLLHRAGIGVDVNLDHHKRTLQKASSLQ